MRAQNVTIKSFSLKYTNVTGLRTRFVLDIITSVRHSVDHLTHMSWTQYNEDGQTLEALHQHIILKRYFLQCIVR